MKQIPINATTEKEKSSRPGEREKKIRKSK